MAENYEDMKAIIDSYEKEIDRLEDMIEGLQEELDVKDETMRNVVRHVIELWHIIPHTDNSK